MLASQIQLLSFPLSAHLFSNLWESPGIIALLQMMFAVISGITEKHVCMYCTRNRYITLSRDQSLTSVHALRLESTCMPLFRHDLDGILKYRDDLNFLKVYP